MAKGTIVVSLRSKGLPSFNKSVILDIRYQAVQLATEFLDIFLATVVTFACLSWSAWISVAVAIVSIAGTTTTNFAYATGDMVFVFFMYIVLPLLVLLTFVFRRRDRALHSLSEFKSAFVSLVLHRPTGSTQQQRDASNELYQKAATFIEDLRLYLQHRRPYARHFYLPYRSTTPSPTDQLLKVSRELGLLLRRVHRGVRDMHLACERLREAGVNEAQIASLVTRVEAVHTAVERLVCVKEMRTPVVLRATIRWFVVVLIPVAMGPFWNSLSTIYSNKAFAGIVGVLLQVALVGIMDTVVAMEDPFDDTALDAISLFELLDQVGVMTTAPSDGDGYDTEGLGAGPRDAAGNLNTGGEDTAAAHVAMYVSGGVDPANAAALAAAAETGAPGLAAGAAPGPAQGQGHHGQMLPPPQQQPVTSVSGSSAGGGLGHVPSGAVEQAPQHHAPERMVQPSGMPAMRGSIVTSETAVGPPSMMELYNGGGGGGGTALPSITSPPLHDMVGVIRAGVAVPPMPALAGQPMARTNAAVY